MKTIYKVIFAIVLAIIVLMLFQNYSNKELENEKFRVKARAFYSCPPTNCQNKITRPDDMLIVNPFVWPYSGSMHPAEVLTTEAPSKLVKSEPDHDPLST